MMAVFMAWVVTVTEPVGTVFHKLTTLHRPSILGVSAVFLVLAVCFGASAFGVEATGSCSTPDALAAVPSEEAWISPEFASVCMMAHGVKATVDMSDYELILDSGSNRFGTNDVNDFVPASIVYSNTHVSVGGGIIVSPCYGSMLIRSHETGEIIECRKTLLLPECDKKLMPVAPFLDKGYRLVIDHANGASMVHIKSGKILFTGKEVEGLYHFHCSVHHVTPTSTDVVRSTQNTVSSASKSAAFFGLPTSGHIKADGAEFAGNLTDAHCALGHMDFEKVRWLYCLKKGENPSCPICAIAKQKKGGSTMPIVLRSTRINHRIHMDIFFTEGSANPCQLYVDDCSRVSYIDLLDGKDEALPKWKELKLLLENRHFPEKFAFMKTDNEFIYTSEGWRLHCLEVGMEHEFSPRYRHDRNGVVERAIGVVGTTFRCLMIQGGAPASDIPNALVHANVIRNHTPTEANNRRTPKEKELGMKLSLNKRLLKGPLFCLVYAAIYAEERIKHGDRSIACVYLGYDDRNDSFKVKEWASGRIYYTGDATFFPRVFPYRASPTVSQQWINEMDKLVPGYPVSRDNPAPHAMPTGPRRSMRQHGYHYSGDRNVREIPDVDSSPDVQVDYPVQSRPVHQASQPEANGQPDQPAMRDNRDPSANFQALVPRGHQRKEGAHLSVGRACGNGASSSLKATSRPFTSTNPDVLRASPQVIHVSVELDPPDLSNAFFVHSFGADPSNWTEANTSRFASEWQLASLKEKQSFEDHKVLELVTREFAVNTGKRIWKPKAVFKIKIKPPSPENPEPTIDKFKFRQTIAAFTKMMKKGIDFTEKRASTVRWESYLVLISIAVHYDLEITLIDICTFFLYGELDDLVFMEQPPEWVDRRTPAKDYVCRVTRSMYGLPQAPHCAQRKLKQTLLAPTSNLKRQAGADDCVYTSGGSASTNPHYVALGTHVDDILTVSTKTGLSQTVSTLEKQFKLTVKRNPSLITGVQLERSRDHKWAKLHQEGYIETILEEFGMSDCHSEKTPMNHGLVHQLMNLPPATPETADPAVRASPLSLPRGDANLAIQDPPGHALHRQSPRKVPPRVNPGSSDPCPGKTPEVSERVGKTWPRFHRWFARRVAVQCQQ